MLWKGCKNVNNYGICTVLADSLLRALARRVILNYRDVQRDIGHKWFQTPFLEMGCL